MPSHIPPDDEERRSTVSRDAIKRRIHERAAEGRAAVDVEGSLADELIEERREDRSLA
ncbi:MAG: hypothetical protein WEB03_08430 [Nitriliruptor sp.]|uniref:hypothetical protein n=1 Tax=Nitriliruptor sp. TaxID=2448056 RepID=UPI0034A01824